MAKILYVVHRYAPFPGGSENYVRDMAEQTAALGHEVCVFAGENQGDWNGIRVTNFVSVFNAPWDLIVVHGGDVAVQDFVLRNAKHIKSPILFMLIVPSMSSIYLQAIQDVKYIGCSTHEDWDYVKQMGVFNKSVRIPHGIDPKISVGHRGFRKKYDIKTKYMFLSCGGYWPNKAMHELVETFNQIGRDDVTLVLTGYDNRHKMIPKETEFVKPLMLDNRDDVMSAIREADLYIMHSHKEGFGLVLLESMFNGTPWAARNIAGAKLLNEFGFTYENDSDLLDYMKTFKGVSQEKLDDAYEYLIHNHTIEETVNSILECIEE